MGRPRRSPLVPCSGLLRSQGVVTVAAGGAVYDYGFFDVSGLLRTYAGYSSTLAGRVTEASGPNLHVLSFGLLLDQSVVTVAAGGAVYDYCFLHVHHLLRPH